MKKLTVLILLFAVLLLMGCENVVFTEKLPEPEESTDIYTDLQSQLPDFSRTEESDASEGDRVSYLGDYIIATDSKAAFYPDENTPGTISHSIEERNQFLRDKYGVAVKVIQTTGSQLTKALTNAAKTNEKFCDLVAISGEDTVTLYLNGLLADMNTLPEFDPESELFYKDSTAFATNSSLYMLADPTALVYDRANVLFYNRELLENAGVADPYELAAQGKWTWDVFNTVARTAAASSYNNASSDIEKDVFGFGANKIAYGYTLAMWYSSGNKMIPNAYKTPVQLFSDDKEVLAVSKATRQYYEVRGKYPNEGEQARNAFESGRLVFMSNTLDYLFSLRDGSVNGKIYGFLPMPKYSEDQAEYACLLDTSARVLSLPKTLESESESEKLFAGYMLGAICAAGGATIRDAYLKANIAMYLYDNTEAVVLETVVDSIVFDFANVFGTKITAVARATTDSVSDYYEFGSALTYHYRSYIQAFNKYSEENFT